MAQESTESLMEKLNLIRANTAPQALQHVHKQAPFPNAPAPHEFLPIVVGGGIGDLIVSLPLIARVKEMVGKVKVWSCNPDVHRYFCGPEDIGEGKYFPGAAYWLKVETAPRFFCNSGNKIDLLPRDVPMFAQWLKAREKDDQIERFAHYQPHFDGELAEAARKHRLHRWQLPHYVMGFPIDEDCVPRLWPKAGIAPLGEGSFITVHDGIDASQVDILYRSTKQWTLDNWQAFVSAFKEAFPRTKVVQLGGPRSRPIPGVDRDFTGRFTIEQSLNVLAQSHMHVDGESGLVHAAHAMGVKSVVLFGPTSSKFFGYPDNINLDPYTCGECFWINRTWVKECPLFQTPRCIDSTTPSRVLEAVASWLDESWKAPQVKDAGQEKIGPLALGPKGVPRTPSEVFRLPRNQEDRGPSQGTVPPPSGAGA
jgi:hypothetical protein